MPHSLPFFNWSLKKVLAREDDPITQARIKMVYYGLVIGLLLSLAVIPYYAIRGLTFQLSRSILLTPVFLVLIKLHLTRRIWKEIIHFGLVVLTFLIVSNILTRKYVSAVTVQYAVLVILYSLYGLGEKWGAIYTSVNLLFILGFLLFAEETYDASKMGQAAGKSAFIAVLSVDFLLIFLSHNLFYRSFYNNIQQLKKAVKAKSDFMSTMSHELRTPLNAVIGMSNLMISDDPGKDQKENLRILKFSAENLLTVVNDVLDFSKIESGMIELEEISFNLNALLRNICSGMRLQATEKQLELRLQTDPLLDSIQVIGDPARLTQIMFNLVGNAIKFTRKGHVSVTCRITRQTDEHLLAGIEVSDTGIGISKDKQELIFQPFTQASRNTTREFGGTGLGLSIVRHLLTLLNSRMELTSAEGEGATFSFQLPFKRGETVVPAAPVQGEQDAPLIRRKLNVLLAEDNAINIMLIRKLLARWWNIEPVVAQNGEEALDLARNSDFDLVLMDMHMPVMDGYEAVKRIRALDDKERAAVHIIALTASVSFSGGDLSETGVDDYIMKPFNPEKLKEKLERTFLKRETSHA